MWLRTWSCVVLLGFVVAGCDLAPADTGTDRVLFAQEGALPGGGMEVLERAGGSPDHEYCARLWSSAFALYSCRLAEDFTEPLLVVAPTVDGRTGAVAIDPERRVAELLFETSDGELRMRAPGELAITGVATEPVMRVSALDAEGEVLVSATPPPQP